MKDLSIRRACVADAGVLVRHNLAMAKETEGKDLDQPTVVRGTRAVFSSGNRGFYLLAERHGRVVGQLMVTREWSDWRDGDFWWIQSVYVLPEERKRGVFTALFRHVESEARKDGGVCGLRLYTREDNQTARAAYRSLGMHRTAYRLFEIDWAAPS